ncbi:MAG: metal-dependent transcriptional regulator [Anaerolineae bacterium]|nr:metal-dependent transcriptional regulator [Anaerolineae bacterium]
MQLSASGEDYLRAALVLSSRDGFVRITDLADYLSVKPPSAVSAVKKLAREGLVCHEPYGRVELTGQGRQVAEELHRRHETLVAFLTRFLGLDERTAEEDACHMEHTLSVETLSRIVKFLRFLEACPAGQPRCLKALVHYMATDSLPTSCPQECSDGRSGVEESDNLPSQADMDDGGEA